jgi:hypothetical protein
MSSKQPFEAVVEIHGPTCSGFVAPSSEPSTLTTPGSMGGYVGGLDVKTTLLAITAAWRTGKQRGNVTLLKPYVVVRLACH